MNIEFWKNVQKCWRKTLSANQIDSLDKMTDEAIMQISSTEITKTYSKNPLDDFEDDEDDDD